jgi:hypothetical protein
MSRKSCREASQHLSLYVHKYFVCRLLLLARRIVRLQFLCDIFIKYGVVPIRFYLPHYFFLTILQTLEQLKLIVGFSVIEITCYHVGILRGDAQFTQLSRENVSLSVETRESVL